MQVELAADFSVADKEDDEYDDAFNLDHSNDDNSSLEGERCGICMDVVIDRGVLDCCQHWYCFTCIDNWATITNLCPLCQNEFQSITCVPMYDTIGSNNGDDDMPSREDDWNIEGENNTLSFPSYYIDENAVICLDGDGCKIRNGSVKIEDDPDLDTSIACDSCDVWYHAFCVGFDTEATCETFWFCPGCIANEKLEFLSGSLSGKVSISIADAGETAVVVSMVENDETQNIEIKNQTSEGPSENLLPTPAVDKFPKIELQNIISNIDFPKLEASLENIRIQTLKSQAASNASPEQSELKAISIDFPLNESIIPSRDLLEEPCSRNEPFGRSPSLSDDTKKDVAGEYISGNDGKESTLECLSQDVNVASERKDNAHVVTSMKRKLRDNRNEETQIKAVAKASKKNVKIDSHNIIIDQKKENTASGSQRSISKRGKDGSDIMSIVQGPNRKEREKAAGLRVKKIMRRDTKDKESSVLVENLRKEIREAVRIKSNLGENQINPELLAAFRVAVSGSVSESAKNSPALALKAKKVILQKGKIRENLTKKIYGIGGKRKRAWTRDCEIEFWKHRCLQAGKPEKIDTLKSVLNLLRKSSDEREFGERVQGKATSSILSRLYLADSSVFPRKDDIKPFSDIGTSIVPENSVENISTSNLGNNVIKTQQICKESAQGVKTTNIKDEIIGKSDDVTKDKKKWALEILARKTAATSKATNGIQEEDPVFKKNYPLLTQLPLDMRPVLAPSRHKKIPVSVRQAQLYRLTEHFLRKTNIPEIRRTADTELAVADAVNIEKEIADKSNSKLVYTNLMSQKISNRLENIISNITQDIDPSLLITPIKKSEEIVEDPTNDPSVEEALKNAGFLSDSPPNSPINGPSKEIIGGEKHENFLEMGSNPEADIYGDFEYNLEDEDFIGVSAIKISKPLEEESKIKVVFSNFISDKLNPECLDEKTEIKVEGVSNLVPEIKEIDVEIECDELYGPDKEPLVNFFPESEKDEFSGSNETVKETNFENKICLENVIPPCVGEDGPVCSETSEYIPKEDKLSDTGTKRKSETGTKKQSDSSSAVSKKVEAYIKEHIRPLCKSGVITVEQYRWAVEKTTEKVMKYHFKEKNAKFLIKEGEKVKKLAEQYVEASQHKKK